MAHPNGSHMSVGCVPGKAGRAAGTPDHSRIPRASYTPSAISYSPPSVNHPPTAVSHAHPFRGNRQIERAVEAASLPRAPPAVKTPIHTQHTGRHGDDGLVELLPAGPVEATEHHRTSRVVLGQRARFWPKCISHWSRGNTGMHPWPAPKACYNGERPDPRTPVWPYRSNREDLVKTVLPPCPMHTHTRCRGGRNPS